LVFNETSPAYRRRFLRSRYPESSLPAYDEAWKDVAPRISENETTVEAARPKLASIVLTVATSESRDAEQIKSAALILMNIGGKVPQ
jgi:hypothetical protein